MHAQHTSQLETLRAAKLAEAINSKATSHDGACTQSTIDANSHGHVVTNTATTIVMMMDFTALQMQRAF